MRKGVKQAKLKMRASDFTIVFLVTALVIFGVVMVFSASYYNSINDTGSPYGYLKKQLLFACIGFVLMYICSVVDYHIWRRLSIFILVISIGLLIYLFLPLPFVETINNATRWIRIGPISIMPGEIAKFAAIVFVSAFLAVDSKRVLSFTRGILPLLLLMAVMAGLIIKQPNLSTAIAVCGIIVGIMFLAGLQWKYIIGAMVLGGGGVAGLLIFVGGYWKERFTSFLNPFEDQLGAGYQVVQSLLALGTGGLFGLGLGKSVQKNLYLPEPQNDFILAIIGEELGFIGIGILMIVYAVLIWRCFHVCLNAPDRFGMLMAGGITIMIGLQVIINVAVVTSSMPPTGITLPFVSYGGNALWIFMACAGIMLNISRKSIQTAPASSQPLKRENMA